MKLSSDISDVWRLIVCEIRPDKTKIYLKTVLISMMLVCKM